MFQPLLTPVQQNKLNFQELPYNTQIVWKYKPSLKICATSASMHFFATILVHHAWIVYTTTVPQAHVCRVWIENTTTIPQACMCNNASIKFVTLL
jgi:hypothetical protein